MTEKIQALVSAYEYIIRLNNGIEMAINSYRIDDTMKGNEMTVAITEGLQWLTEAIDLTSEVQKEPINVTEINGTIAEIISALENEDTVLIADLFEYELLDKLKGWHEKIETSLEDINFENAD